MTPHKPRVLRLLSVALALAAFAFIAYVVPVLDRCWDDRAGVPRVSVSREDSGCMLHGPGADVFIKTSECARLHCEPGLASTFSHARVGVLLALGALYAVGTLAWAARWRALLRLAGVRVSLARVWRVSVEAQAGGILLPGGIGGDALRVAWVLRAAEESGVASPTAIVIASVLLDRAVGLAVVAALAATLGFATGGLHAGPLAVVMAAIPLAFVVGLGGLRWLPVERVRWVITGRLGTMVEPVLRYVRAPEALRAIAVAGALSLCVAGVQFATIRGLIYALGAPVTAEKWVYVGTAMAFIVGAIPALPGAWGTADAAYVFFLGHAGLSGGTALGVALIYRLFWYLCAMVGALLFVTRSRTLDPSRRATPSESEPRT